MGISIALGLVDALSGAPDERRAKEREDARQALYDDSVLPLSAEQKFYWHCMHGELAEVERLLKEGVNPNFSVQVDLHMCETTPLLEAALVDNEELMRLLLKYGADVNYRLKDGATILHTYLLRTRLSDSDIVELLCEAGADVNAADNAGYVPLHYCHEHKLIDNMLDAHYRCEKVLRRFGASDSVPYPGLFSIAEKKFLNQKPGAPADGIAPEVQAYAALLHTCDKRIPFDESSVRAHLAALHASPRKAQMLQELLNEAAGDAAMSALLLQAGADPMLLSNYAFRQALPHAELFYGDAEQRRRLSIEFLHEKVEGVKDEELQVFIDTFFTQCNRSVNERDSLGNTLFLADLRQKERSYYTSVDVHLRNGADVNAVAHDGITPIMLAECIEMKPLLKAGADVLAVDAAGNSVLHHFASRYDRWGEDAWEMATVLAAGASPDAKNHDGKTPSDLLRERGIRYKWDILSELSIERGHYKTSYDILLRYMNEALEMLDSSKKGK
ncbi:MAG: ankyrin repeat domain-containing protein [Akkermansia sp.]|nr:ankyrin repeat domain-containing protein [Akkermansia sp.]